MSAIPVQEMPEKATVLFVDDERFILMSLTSLFRSSYRVLSTTDPKEALEIVRREKVDVIVSDQRMPQMLGAELLRQVRRISPSTMRILLTGYSDMPSVISSINDGEVFRFINKPWSNDEIRTLLASAVQIARNTGNVVPREIEPEDDGQALVQPLSSIDASVLVIDDEGDLLDVCLEAMGDSPRCFVARDLESALRVIDREKVDIIVSDVSVAGQDVSDFVKVLKAMNPAISTIVTSRNLDSSIAINLINEGQIYRYLKRPVQKGVMRLSLMSAARHVDNVRAVPALKQRHIVADINQIHDQILFRRLLTRYWPFCNTEP
ncbi:MAG TPA: response regulator [Pseudomonas sp.]|uniref:response regulator n=1 Tax=Pseudomonas sp. TaxID=306 RepID=UPI0026100BC4|nr:response regulator [Pseudomonas sp.]HSX90552.1 response regulator [Pseudomonas sp.]